MSNLLSELKRRNVIRVAAAYAVVGWLLIQVADIGLESFGAPDWVMKTVLLLVLIGLPLAIVLAWVFELTPDGVRRDSDVSERDSTPPSSSNKLNFVIIGTLVVALVFFVVESRNQPTGGSQAVVEKSIAVLPFINIGGNAEDEYLSDGLAETLLHMLAQIEEIQVAARTSAFKFKNTNEDVRIIGEQLGVATVLEGSIQRSGDKIRITAQLINVDSGFHLWSANFDRTINDIFVVQDEIASSVVAALQVTLLGNAPPVNERNAQAYDALLRLKDDVRSGSIERSVSAIESLQALVAQYPDYVDAYAELATAYIFRAARGGLIPEEWEEKALAAAEDAVRLGPDSAAANTALAHVLTGREDFVQAGPVIARALRLEPGNAGLMVDQATVMTSRFEFNQAAALMERVVRLDPLNPATRASLSNIYVSLGRGEEAKAMMVEIVENAPDNADLVYQQATMLQDLGESQEALSAYRQLADMAPTHIGAWQGPVMIYVDLGDFDQAEHYVLKTEELSVNRATDERALYCFVMGDTECQHRSTERMIATRDGYFVQVWHAKMLLEKDMIAEAIAVMEPLDFYYDQSGSIYGNLQTRVNLGALYHLANDFENRDRILSKVRRLVEYGVDNGWASWTPDYFLAAADAAEGDLAASIAHLEQARKKGFGASSNLEFDFLWDPYRSDPKFQEVRARIEATNTQ
jgi:TolB-like protein/Flp pilus assembly protein TadD